MKQNVSLALLIESWKQFLNDQIEESVSEKNRLEIDLDSYDEKKREDFIEIFCKSKESCIFALSLLKKNIEDYEKLKTKNLDSSEYTNLVDAVFDDKTKVLQDDKIKKLIQEFTLLIKDVEEELKKYN